MFVTQRINVLIYFNFFLYKPKHACTWKEDVSHYDLLAVKKLKKKQTNDIVINKKKKILVSAISPSYHLGIPPNTNTFSHTRNFNLVERERKGKMTLTCREEMGEVTVPRGPKTWTLRSMWGASGSHPPPSPKFNASEVWEVIRWGPVFGCILGLQSSPPLCRQTLAGPHLWCFVPFASLFVPSSFFFKNLFSHLFLACLLYFLFGFIIIMF